jgi:hypothetical protein
VDERIDRALFDEYAITDPFDLEHESSRGSETKGKHLP